MVQIVIDLATVTQVRRVGSNPAAPTKSCFLIRHQEQGLYHAGAYEYAP